MLLKKTSTQEATRTDEAIREQKSRRDSVT